MQWPEFYPEKQGRPDSKVAFDLEKRQPSIPPGYISGIHMTASYSETTIINNYNASGKTLILVDASSGPVVVTLPEALVNSNKYYIIKKIDSSSNVVTIKGNTPAETIDGEVTLELTLQYQYTSVVCDGSRWYIIGGEYVKIEDILSRLLNEQIQELRQLVLEMRQVKLHLAGMSDEPISEEDTDDC